MMNRMTGICLCCGHSVEWLRDSISGPNHYRCGNCFEIVELDELEAAQQAATEIHQLEEQKNAILTAHRRNRS